VVSTGSTSSHNAARRAALVAREHGWPLRILHAERDPQRIPAAQEAAEQLCGHLRERLGIAVAAEVTPGDLLKAMVTHTQACSLLVIGSPRHDALREQVGGVAMDRLIRLSRIPTLVVKRQVDAAFAHGAPDVAERGRYARVLACVGLDKASAPIAAGAKALAPNAHVEAFHAVSARAASSGFNRQADTESTVLGRARSELTGLLQESAALSCVPSVAFGHPADAILARERAIGADLVVVGKRHRGLLADFFLGDVTRSVLARASADVLVLPANVLHAAGD
jgi:nucleotide-binding universal stress UspA family protein